MRSISNLPRLEQVARYTRSIPGAMEVLNFLKSEAVIARLTNAAADGIPPVTAISADVVALLGVERSKNAQLSKFIGRAVKLIMEDTGFELTKRNVRTRNDPIFSVASAYRKVDDKNVSNDGTIESELLYRLLGTLRTDELNLVLSHAQKLLKERLRSP